MTYTYLTNDFTLPACQIVLLYKHRWDIEKIFHQFKSKMGERKAWASSLAAKQSHAIFECLAHNLLLLFEQHIRQSEGLCDETECEKQRGRTKGPAGLLRAPGNFINTAVQSATQRTARFIRWSGSGSTNKLPGATPSPGYDKSGPVHQPGFPHRSKNVRETDKTLLELPRRHERQGVFR